MATIVFQEGPNPPKPALRKKQLLAHIIDGMAMARPQAVYAEYPTSSTDYSAGFSKITYAAFANAINGLTWWLNHNIGNGSNFETLTYTGPNDFRHNALVLAASKAGYKMLLCSPRNTVAGYRNLFTTLDCKVLLIAEPRPLAVDSMLRAHPLRVLQVPTVDDLLGQKYPHYPYKKTFEQARAEPIVVLHTSGTTALPKPIIYTHDWIATWTKMCQLEPPPGTQSLEKLMHGNRLFVMMPPFHAGNILPTLFTAVSNQTTIIFPLPDAVTSTEHFVGVLKHTKADIAAIPPPVVCEIARNPELLEFAGKHLESIVWTGGDVAENYGDVLSTRVQLFNVNGATEMGSYPALRPVGKHTPDPWKYIMPHPIMGVEFRCHLWDNGDAKYEAYVVRNPDPEDEQPIFKVYPHLNEYRSGDLFSPHLSIAGLWSYRGRCDDCFVLLTGSNISPIMMEQAINTHPDVRGVLMLGARQPCPGLLIESTADKELLEAEREEMIERLWPTIEEGNQNYYEAARVAKSMVLFTNPAKPMRRAGKGTVQRVPTLELYAKEIEALYGEA